MHFVGKILVVLQLILSIFFMAFAGVVYNTHVKWNEETSKQKKLVADGAYTTVRDSTTYRPEGSSRASNGTR